MTMMITTMTVTMAGTTAVTMMAATNKVLQ